MPKRFSDDCVENENCLRSDFFIFCCGYIKLEFFRAFCGGIFAAQVLPQFGNFIDTAALYLLRGVKEKKILDFLSVYFQYIDISGGRIFIAVDCPSF